MKKKLHHIFLLIVLGWTLSTNAMLVTIPDANFRAKLQSLFPASFVNGQLETTSNQITFAGMLQVNNLNITDLTGIEYFVNLTYLDCSGNQLISMPNLPATITYLDCKKNKLTSLPTLPSGLESLYSSENPITVLPVLPNSLKILSCSVAKLTSLPVLPSNLENLLCEDNQLTNLPVLPSTLKGLYCGSNHLTNLPALPSGLKTLFCNNNNLDFADLENIVIPLTTIFASPQNFVISPATLTVDSNNTLTINGIIGGTGNHYSWYKNNTFLPGATSAVYTKANVTAADQAIYTCTVTSTLGGKTSNVIINSNQITVTVKSTLAVSNPDDYLLSTQLYPNPGSGVFTVELPENQKQEKTEVIVYNALGQKIISDTQTSKKFTLNLGSQPAGLYLVSLINGNSHTTKKIIKN